MANWTYLNAYLSSIPSAQRQRLLNLLYTKVQTTQIQSVSDYENQFQTDIAKLNTDPTAPVFTLRTQNFRDVTNSANFNDMEANAIGSLKTLYEETILLEDAISNHVSVVDGDIKSIEATIDDLNKQISNLELLAANTDGFITSVYDSFNVDNSNRLTRTSPGANAGFFTDPVLGFIDPNFDATIDNGTLKLPVATQVDFNINTATLENQIPIGITTLEQIAASGAFVPSQQLQYALADLLSPQNVSSYWAETVDVKSLVDASGNNITGAETDLVIGIGGIQQINHISVNPFSRYPYTITDIQYTKNNTSNVWHDLSDILEFPIAIEGLTNIDIPSIYASTLKFHIKQNSYSSLRYITTGVNNTISDLFDVATGTELQPPSSLVNPDTYFYAMTGNMQGLLGITNSLITDTDEINVYEFMYGIKSLGISRVLYSNKGLYVSKPFRSISPAAIGLTSVEDIPELTVVQYRVLVSYKDITDGIETGTDTLEANILPGDISVISNIPVGNQRAYPEIIDGSDDTATGQWSGFTRFAVNYSDDVTVFQNGVEMLPGTFNVEAQTDGTARIWFYSSNNINRNISVFTVNYTPATGHVIDLVKHDVAYITLQIILRSISPDRLLTPLVSSYSMKFKKWGAL